MKLVLTNPMSVGRNFQEVLRAIDGLQMNAKHNVATPADWKPGEDVIIPTSVTDEQAKAKFPGGWKAVKPYLRVTRPPAA